MEKAETGRQPDGMLVLRTLAMPRDSNPNRDIFGGGVERRFGEKSALHVNLNYYDTGEKKIDTEPTPLSGRIVGESTDHYSIGLDIAFIYRF